MALNSVPEVAELLYLGAAMSAVTSICAEFGIVVVAPAQRRPGGKALETCAAATLQRLLSDWGKSHLREVLRGARSTEDPGAARGSQMRRSTLNAHKKILEQTATAYR